MDVKEVSLSVNSLYGDWLFFDQPKSVLYAIDKSIKNERISLQSPKRVLRFFLTTMVGDNVEVVGDEKRLHILIGLTSILLCHLFYSRSILKVLDLGIGLSLSGI